MLTSVLHYCETSDYEPNDGATGSQVWLDYIVSGGPSVRAIIHLSRVPGSAHLTESEIEVVGFDRWGAIWFKYSFDGNVPTDIIVASLQAAETWALAEVGRKRVASK